MNRVCCLRLGPNFELQPPTDKIFYLRLRVEKMYVFKSLTKIYLRSCGCNGTNFAAAVNCACPKTGIQRKITDKQIIEIRF